MSPRILKTRAEIYNKQENYKKAASDISATLELDPYWFDGYIKLAAALFSAQQPQEAMQPVELYLNLFPEDTAARFLCGNIYYNAQKYLKALECFNACLVQNKAEPAYFLARGKTYMQSSTYKYAAKDFSMALDLQPSAEGYLLKGLARQKLNEAEGACHDWRKAYQLGNKEAMGYILDNCQDQ
ncbi:MAG: hypothetical protein HC896_04285 [Bacteroidales bacterium]|nr:hypothetical protein [Bacteroidales bacterium]